MAPSPDNLQLPQPIFLDRERTIKKTAEFSKKFEVS
jgi:hypothetical protein